MDFKRLIREELSDFEWVGDITTEKTVGEWLKLSNQELEEIFYESKPIVKLTGKTYLDSDKQGFINIDNYFEVLVVRKSLIRLMILDIPGNKPEWWGKHFGTSHFGIDGSIESDLNLVMTSPINREDINESDDFGWVSDIEETSNLIPMETHIGTEFRIFWDNDSWLGPVMKKWYHVGSGDTFKLKSIETYQEGITTQFVGDSGEDGKFSLSVPLDTEFDDENWRPSKYGIHIEWV
tara:strand:- start:2132 stop:2839 length:708 start_codon:yes stop_codon:yes gene_type:complete